MPRIERSAPAATHTPVPVRRIGRVSAARPSAEEREKLEKMIDNHLKLIAIDQNRIDYLQASIQPEINTLNQNIERVKEVLREELVRAKMDGYTDGKWEAKFLTEMTKASRDVDPVKVKAKLSEADFLKTVKVQVTLLRTFMSEREIDACSTITPAAPGATKFVVQPVSEKKPAAKPRK